jgi:hypothetical protein
MNGNLPLPAMRPNFIKDLVFDLGTELVLCSSSYE